MVQAVVSLITKEEFEKDIVVVWTCLKHGELLIDESLIGWKEYEMEVVRDKNDNCIIVCAIENFDPMGIHTGDSITVAPAQAATDKEYQLMRNTSLAVLRIDERQVVQTYRREYQRKMAVWLSSR